ncbi:MAG: (Fe-S)-binding protein [Gemmatimonadales bacterium]|nr:(Fe-S)-binding protein [Gemmatimonadales bacterium]
MADQRQTAKSHLAELLRSCVQCGLCLPTCATWLATGNEVHSPRGRLLLLEEVLNIEDPDTNIPVAFLAAFDHCIGCRACETACPSGVPFSLLEYGQGLAGDLVVNGSPEIPQPAVPGFVLRRLDSPSVLRFLGRVAGGTRSFFAGILGRRWRSRLDHLPVGMRSLVRLVGSMPTAPETDDQLRALLDDLVKSSSVVPPQTYPEDAPVSDDSPSDVAFFQGCANNGLLSGPSRRLCELLRSAGCRVEVPQGQDCCGALAAHTGRPTRAAAQHHRNREVFNKNTGTGSRIVVEAAGCGLELKEGLGDLGSQVIDAVHLLSGLNLPVLRAVPLKVAVHDPCHARHGQGISQQPRELLSRIPGLTLVEAAEVEVCCGSGGVWGLRYPEISEQLGRRKAENLATTGADLVVTSNPGCLGQIADGLALIAPDLPILPLTDLVWYAVKPE